MIRVVVFFVTPLTVCFFSSQEIDDRWYNHLQVFFARLSVDPLGSPPLSLSLSLLPLSLLVFTVQRNFQHCLLSQLLCYLSNISYTFLCHFSLFSSSSSHIASYGVFICSQYITITSFLSKPFHCLDYRLFIVHDKSVWSPSLSSYMYHLYWKLYKTSTIPFDRQLLWKQLPEKMMSGSYLMTSQHWEASKIHLFFPFALMEFWGGLQKFSSCRKRVGPYLRAKREKESQQCIIVDRVHDWRQASPWVLLDKEMHLR